MSVAYSKIFRQVANELGAFKAATASDAETNYTATLSTSTLKGPDFTPSMIEDAVVNAMAKIVQAIIETPQHTERPAFIVTLAALGNNAPMPSVVSGNLVMGNIQMVRDASNGIPCSPTTIDKITSYQQHKTGIYAGLDVYNYAIVGATMFHTRTSVSVEFSTWSRPTSFSGDIPLRDYHERALVMGAVAFLAPKEGMFAALQNAAENEFQMHISSIRAQYSHHYQGAAGGAVDGQ